MTATYLYYSYIIEDLNLQTFFHTLTIGPERVKIMPQPSTATEDFANYLFKVPGTFMWLGCCSGEDTAYPLHHPKFNMDEKALKTGVAAHLSIVNEYLNTDAQLEFGK